MADLVKLSNVIFDKGRKITQANYQEICESIEDDRLTLNEYVIEYKKRDAIAENLFFTLKDGSRILLDEDVINTIRGLNIDHDKLVGYMSESKENFNKVMKEILNGIN